MSKYWSDSPRITVGRWLWKDKLELLFSIELEFQRGLDKCNISNDLRQEFREHKIQLSDVSIKEKGCRWLITDRNDSRWTYCIKKEEGKLNIYGDGLWNKAIKRFLLPSKF